MSGSGVVRDSGRQQSTGVTWSRVAALADRDNCPERLHNTK